MYSRKLEVDDLESKQGEYSGSAAYALAKRGLVVMSERWAERWHDKGVIVHSMHPGWALTPAIETALPGFTKVMKHSLRTPLQGADTVIWLATASEAGKCSGLFWLDRTPQPTHLMSKTIEDPQSRDELEQVLQDYHQRLIG
jgi:NAD(P)-dependent dehydrogenase (short-subunit alcohol dehydrogenase family)